MNRIELARIARLESNRKHVNRESNQFAVYPKILVFSLMHMKRFFFFCFDNMLKIPVIYYYLIPCFSQNHMNVIYLEYGYN